MGKYVWQVCATMEKLLDYVAKLRIIHLSFILENRNVYEYDGLTPSDGTSPSLYSTLSLEISIFLIAKSIPFDSYFNVYVFICLTMVLIVVNFNQDFSPFPIAHFEHIIQKTGYFTDSIQKVSIFHSRMLL